MSRLMSKFPHAAGWFAAGIGVAVLVIPTAVTGAASVLTYTGIEGATGGTLANVTKAGQLEVTPAGAGQIFVRTITGGVNGDPTELKPPAGDALIITGIHVFSSLSSCGYSIYLSVHGLKQIIGGFACTPGITVLPFSPGLPLSSGVPLSFLGRGVDFSVIGYTVPAAAVPAGA